MEKTTKQNILKHIVLTGPESTGKTGLAISLAKFYNTVYVPEYAREFVEKNNYKYSYNDVLHIAKTQIDKEQQQTKLANKILFVDTDIIITKIWLIHVFKKCPEWINNEIKKMKRDLYLLCYYDLPWQFDKARENPEIRKYLFDMYEDELIKYGFKYKIIKGKNEERLQNAIIAVDSIL